MFISEDFLDDKMREIQYNMVDQFKKPTMWRTRVEVYIIMPDNKLLVGELPGNNYLGAGGGVEEGQNLKQAAVIECLEELGVLVRNFKVINKRNPFLYDFWKKRKHEPGKTKKRSSKYRGVKIYYGYAFFVKYDDRYYGRDKDEMKRVIITKQQLINSKKKHIYDFDPEMAKFQIEQIKRIPI